MRRLILALILSLLATRAAHAACSSLPYTFTEGVSVVDASTTNANNSHFQTCATQVDNTQVGTSGFYATQILPTSDAQATFGGSSSITYTFPGAIAGVSLEISGSITASTFTASGGTIYLNPSGSAYLTFPGSAIVSSEPFSAPSETITASVNVNGGYVPPAFNIAGASFGSNEHIVRGTTTIAIGSSALYGDTELNISGAAVFASAASYQCMVINQQNTSTYPSGWAVNAINTWTSRISGTQIEFFAGSSSNSTSTSTGTIGVDYICDGV